jgi:ABC-2 type transport system ATP-binding protein
MIGTEPPQGSAPPPLEAEGLGKTFRERSALRRGRPVTALEGMSMALRPGEAFGLIGPNGAGKSTAIKLFTGLIFPSHGQVRLNGGPPTESHCRKGLGVVPENPSLYLHLTPRETLYSAARLHGLGHAAARERSDVLLERLGLAEVAGVLVRKFSKGMAQRVALGQALAGNPHLLILDEPLTGLDPVWRRRVVDMLAEFRGNGGTLLFSSHILADVERLADRIGLLLQGRLQEVTATAELLARNLDRYTVRFAGGSAAPLPDAVAETSGHWHLEVGAGGLWPALERIREGGGTLLEVHPGGAGLEDILMARIGELGEGSHQPQATHPARG